MAEPNVITKEPVVTAATVSGIIIALLSIFGVDGVDLTTVQTLVAAVLPLVLSLFARQAVTPTAKL